MKYIQLLLIISLVCIIGHHTFKEDVYKADVTYYPKSEYALTIEERVQVNLSHKEDNTDVGISISIDKDKIVYYEGLSITIDEASLIFRQPGKYDKQINISDISPIENWMKGTGSDNIELVLDLSDLSAGDWNATIKIVCYYDKVGGVYNADTGELLYSYSELLDNTEFSLSADKSENGWDENYAILGVPDGLDVNIVTDDDGTLIGPYAFRQSDNIREIILNDGLQIIQSGSFYNSSISNIYLPETIVSIDGEGNNQSGYIGDKGSFESCENLSKIHLPNSITILENNVFKECTSLQDINLENISKVGNYAFYECSNLSDINLCNTEHIGEHSFEDCDTLRVVNITDKLEYIDNYAFKNCIALQSFELTDNLDYIGISGFADSGIVSLHIPKHRDDTTRLELDEYAFSGCNSLVDLVFEEGCKAKLKNYCFSYCDALKSVVIPETVKAGSYQSTFERCTGLESAVLYGDNLAAAMFRECNNLNSVTLVYDNFTSVPASAFAGCVNLVDINIPRTYTTVGAYAFASCYKITESFLHDGITHIYDGAFQGCQSIEEIVMPSSVTYIGDLAYWNCFGLKSIVLPEGITKIREETFRNCYSLTSIIIPNSVIEIEAKAFRDCYVLKDVQLSNQLQILEEDAFKGCDTLSTIVLPDSLQEIGEDAFMETLVLTANKPSSLINCHANAFPEGFQWIEVYTVDDLCDETSSIFELNTDEYLEDIQSEIDMKTEGESY